MSICYTYPITHTTLLIIVRSSFFKSGHWTNVLHFFKMKSYINASDKTFESSFVNYGQWLNATGIRLPYPATPVCYGGNFATTIETLKRRDRTFWTYLYQNLTRADNMEEGHFMERTWAGLLTGVNNFSSIADGFADETVHCQFTIPFYAGLLCRKDVLGLNMKRCIPCSQVKQSHFD